MKKIFIHILNVFLCVGFLFVFNLQFTGCKSKTQASAAAAPLPSRYIFPDDFMADPSAHVFNGKLYIYPSHDRRTGITNNATGDAFDMVDYHVLSIDDPLSSMAVDHGMALHLKDIPWAVRQLWDNDVAHKNGKYYMYFPARDKDDVFRIGVAIADRPEGPFIPQPEPIPGSYSIDPCIYEENGEYYMYFGGMGKFYPGNKSNNARVVKLSDDMLHFAEEPREVILQDKNGRRIPQGDTFRRFFEAAWMHKYKDKYYFSYSTGDTHRICYAIGDNPYGPFTYEGIVLTPVVGWTNHHSIVEYKNKWYLFFHDSKPSGGVTWLRSLKVVELFYGPDGTIITTKGGGTGQ